MGQCRPTVGYRPNRIVPFLEWSVVRAGIQQNAGLSGRVVVRSRNLCASTSVHRSGFEGSLVIRPIITASLHHCLPAESLEF